MFAIPRLAPTRLLIPALAAVLTLPAVAEVRIELGTERVGDTPPAAVAKTAGGLFGVATGDKDNDPSSNVWLLPYVIDDSVADGPTTLFSVRHADNESPIIVGVEYLDEFANELFSESLSLQSEELEARNLNLLPAVVDPGDVATGFVRLTPTDDVAVDYFLVDDAGNFASGGPAVDQDDFCYEWQPRFLRFGAADTEGSRLVFIINGPLGNDPMGQPTVRGEIFDEDGTFSNSFEIFTDEWVLEVEALELVNEAGPDFGTMRLTIESSGSPAGAVFERHTAFGQFSVGNLSVCRTEDEPAL